MKIYDNLNSFERKQLYDNCEKNNIKFVKTRYWTDKWICAKHSCLLKSVKDACCSSPCCLICPKDSCCEDIKKVNTKLRRVTVFENP